MPARIIFKAHYLSGKKSGHIENYIEYMGTRPGVEVFDDDGSPATEKQKQLIEQLLEDCGKGMSESFEYEDYLLKPTKAMLFLGQSYLSGTNVPKNIEKGLELLRASAAQGNAYASKTLEGFYAGAAHTAIAVLYKLSMILRGNTAAMTAKSPVMPAVDRKEWLSILRKKAEQGIRYD